MSARTLAPPFSPTTSIPSVSVIFWKSENFFVVASRTVPLGLYEQLR